MITLYVTDTQNFPLALLEGCDTGLVLFSAAFHGRQDAYWLNKAGLAGTCVDMDSVRLAEMQPMYPADWDFVAADVYSFAIDNRDRQWDIVTLDPFTQDMEKAARFIGDFCRMARRAVILGTGVGTYVQAPEGWCVTDRRLRTMHDGGVYWTVLEPA